MNVIETKYTDAFLKRCGFNGTTGHWIADDWQHGVIQVTDDNNHKWEFRTWNIHAGERGRVIGEVRYSTALGGYDGISIETEAEANAHLISAAPDLLSELMQACSACECYMRLHDETEIPAWYERAKAAINKALNLKTVKPSLTRDPEEDYCSLEQAIELKKQGYTIDKPDYYWVDLSAWGKGYKLMSAQDAEYRGTETKHTAFIDFDTTYPAFEAQDADELLNLHT